MAQPSELPLHLVAGNGPVTDYEYRAQREVRAKGLVEQIQALDLLDKVVEGPPLREIVDKLLPAREPLLDRLAETGEPLLLAVHPETEQQATTEEEPAKVYSSQMSPERLGKHVSLNRNVLVLLNRIAPHYLLNFGRLIDDLVGDLRLRDAEDMSRSVQLDLHGKTGGKGGPAR